MSTMKTHTPWTVEEYSSTTIEIVGPNEMHVAFIPKDRRENADFIVRCVNNHDALCAALEEGGMSADKEYLKQAAKAVEARLPDNHGFILLTMPFGPGGRLTYTANIDRADAISALKEFLFSIGENENWMKHIK